MQTCELLSLLGTNDWVQNKISLLFFQNVFECVCVGNAGGGGGHDR